MTTDTLRGRLAHWRQEVKDLSYRAFAERVNEELERAGHDEVHYVTWSNWEKADHDPKLRPEVVRAVLDAFPELRLEWFLFGEGEATLTKEELARKFAPEEESRGGSFQDSVRRQIANEHKTFNTLSPASQEVFLEVLAEYASTAPTGGQLAGSEKGREHIVHLAGRLLFLLDLASRGFGFKLPQHRRPQEFNQFAVAFLNSLRPLLAEEGEGAWDIEHAYDDLLQVAREAVEEEREARREQVSDATEPTDEPWTEGG